MAEPQAGRTDPSPPRAFTQGVGTVFQFLGVMLFLASMFICCSSSLLSKDVATRTDLTHVGWHFSSDPSVGPTFSAQRAITLAVVCGVFFGMAMAGVGLGLQAQRRLAPIIGTILTAIGAVFWIVLTIFMVDVLQSAILALVCGGLSMVFILALLLSVAAWREMRRTPPPLHDDILPADYKVPYSHYHDDPPEVRLAAEIEQRRQKLAVQQKELEMLEEKIKRKLDE